MLTPADITEALRACFDLANPFGKPVNIVDLGCIEHIILVPDPEAPGAGIAGVPQRQRLRLTLLPASQDEDARAQLAAQIENRLAGLEGLSQTSICLLETPWTPSRLTPEARRSLMPAFPILNNRL